MLYCLRGYIISLCMRVRERMLSVSIFSFLFCICVYFWSFQYTFGAFPRSFSHFYFLWFSLSFFCFCLQLQFYDQSLENYIHRIIFSLFFFLLLCPFGNIPFSLALVRVWVCSMFNVHYSTYTLHCLLAAISFSYLGI